MAFASSRARLPVKKPRRRRRLRSDVREDPIASGSDGAQAASPNPTSVLKELCGLASTSSSVHNASRSAPSHPRPPQHGLGRANARGLYNAFRRTLGTERGGNAREDIRHHSSFPSSPGVNCSTIASRRSNASLHSDGKIVTRDRDLRCDLVRHDNALALSQDLAVSRSLNAAASNPTSSCPRCTAPYPATSSCSTSAPTH
jgi:hypothetical protein